MSSFIYLNNKKDNERALYNVSVIQNALLKTETKSQIKAESLTKHIVEPVSLTEALSLFSDKLKAISILRSSRTDAINEAKEIAINEAKFKFSEKEVKDASERLAKAMAKLDNVHVAVHDFEYDEGKGAGFELSWGGEEFDGGSYYIKANGDVINAAVGGGTKYGTMKSSEKDFIKGIKDAEPSMRESVVNENGWGSSDQGNMNKSIHNTIGKPSKMPSPFDDSLRSAAEEEVDSSWNDWKEYESDRDGLIDKAVRHYLNSFFKKEFSLMQKMFASNFISADETHLFEGGMSDIYIVAQDAKDEASFLKDFFKEFGDKVKKTADSIEWAKSIYVDAKAMTLENESTRVDKNLGLNEGYMTPKIAKKLSIGSDVVTSEGTYTITGFGQRANAFKQFEAEKDGEQFNIQVSLYGSSDILVAKGKSLNFNERGEMLESLNEGLTIFEKDIAYMIKDIKNGYGWIDPSHVMSTWGNSSDSVPFDIVANEIYKRLIEAKLLANASEDNEEEAGDFIKSLKELGIKESVVNETEVEVITEGRSINKIQKEWSQTTTDMQQKVASWREAEGDRKTEILEELKALTVKKNQLESELEASVAGKDKDVQLAISESLLEKEVAEGNAFGAARAKAIADGEKEFEVEGETYKVEDVDKEDEENAEEFVEESATNEAKEHSFIFNYNTDEDDIKYIQKVLDGAVANAGIDSEEMVIRAFNAKGLKDARKAIEADGFEIQESVVTKPSWETLIEAISQPLTENLRNDVKKFIKNNMTELNTLADNDQWDLVHQKLYTEFEVEAESSEAKDLLKAFEFSF